LSFRCNMNVGSAAISYTNTGGVLMYSSPWKAESTTQAVFLLHLELQTQSSEIRYQGFHWGQGETDSDWSESFWKVGDEN
jgi:hypothetical protein